MWIKVMLDLLNTFFFWFKSKIFHNSYLWSTLFIYLQLDGYCATVSLRFVLKELMDHICLGQIWRTFPTNVSDKNITAITFVRIINELPGLLIQISFGYYGLIQDFSVGDFVSCYSPRCRFTVHQKVSFNLYLDFAFLELDDIHWV